MDREIRTILIIDNSTSILFYLGMLLRRLEYNVITARNAEDAMQIMEQSVPSIVLTDIFLPAKSGIDLMKRIKDTPLWKTIPIVVLTTESDPGMKDTCMRLGCAAYLNKPVEPDVLYRTLQSVTESIPRENIRLHTSLKVIVGDGTVMGGTARTEYATAISEGGLYVRTLYPQPRNALTPISIFIGNREIRAKTVVLYSFTMGGGPFKEPGMGLKFVEIADSDRNFIRGFIKEQLTEDLSPENNGPVPAR
ncbi:MAG TPA: response regulator [Nitrospirota bacterium]|nr:response regulator [Nitrospirota bacterium]